MNQPDFLKVSRKDLLAYMMCSARISWPLWAVGVIGLFVTLVGALSDWRIMLVGLIICLSVAPTIAFFIYFSNLLDSHIMINILPHTVESRPGGYLVRIYRPNMDKVQDEDNSPDSGRESCADRQPDWIETGKMTVFESNVVKRSDSGNFSILTLVHSPVKVLYIPRALHAAPVSCGIRHGS